MSDEAKNTVNTNENPLLDVMNNFVKSNKERDKRYEKHHTSMVNDSGELTKFYVEKVRLDTWLVYGEAISYCMAVEPNHWNVVRDKYWQWEDTVKPLIIACAGTSLKITNHGDKSRNWRVEPKEFVKWLHSKGIRPRQELEDVLKLKFTTNEAKKESSYSEHPNAEYHAQKRQKVVEAALAILANYPDQCMDKGKVSGAAIARIMEEKSPLWFKNDDIPLSARKVRELINQALKLPDA